MTVLIICDVRGEMSPGKCVTAGKSGNSKNKGGKKTGNIRGRRVCKLAAVTSGLALSWLLPLSR